MWTFDYAKAAGSNRLANLSDDLTDHRLSLYQRV
jgi:hypothetical protein